MITSAANSAVKYVHRLLRDKKYRYQQARFAVEGYRQLEGAGSIEALYLSSAAAMPSLAVSPGKVHIIEKKIFDRLADTENTQGVIAVCPLEYETAPGPNRRYVLLDGLQDPGNAGTIIRSAAAFGYGGVIMGPGSVDPFSPKAVRSTMGAIFQCRVALLDDYSALRGCRVVAADIGARDITTVRIEGPYVLAIGSEVRGLSEELRPWITQSVTIPFRATTVNSLNAAVAAGIVMYELNRLQPGDRHLR